MNPMMQVGGMPPMQPPQPPTPEEMALLAKPSWEDVMALLHDNVHRSYRIDIETDSTIAGSLESDMEGLAQVMTAVSSFMKETMPLVQQGILPMDAAKEMLMTIVRRARMGNALEDALDKLVQPKPPEPQPDTAVQVQQLKNEADAQKFQAQQQADQQQAIMDQQLAERDRQAEFALEQQRIALQSEFENQKAAAARDKEMAQMQADERVAQVQAEMQMQIEQNKLSHAAELEQIKAMFKAESERQAQEFDARMEQFKAMQKASVDVLLAHIKKDTAVEVAQIGAASVMSAEQDAAANSEQEGGNGDGDAAKQQTV